MSIQPATLRPLLPFALLGALLGATWLLLVTGTSGSFLFDDLWNLAILGNFPDGIRSWDDLRHYLSINTAGPTGRPVAMLSFVPQQSGWPDDARTMLQGNLFLHGLVGAVVFFLVRALARQVGDLNPTQGNWLALLACALWLLHPLHISTTFYVIQRMAQLSTLFVLLAIWTYIAARERIEAGRWRHGAALLALTALLGLAGLYAKENAVLLPVALLLTEYWFFAQSRLRKPVLQGLRAVFLWLPTGVIAGYLLLEIGSASYATRDFGPSERLATQAHAMLHYVYLLAVPHSITHGIFYDSFPVARSWLQRETITGLLLVSTAIGFSLRYRRQWPMATWGILFFLAMHLVESTTRPLELAYEHRNYLPSVGLALAYAASLHSLCRHYRIAGITAIVLWLSLSATQAHVRADNWGQPDLLAELWVLENPNSPRAWLQYARRAQENADHGAVAHAYMQWQRLQPDSITMQVSLLVHQCPEEPLTEDAVQHLVALASTSDSEPGLMQGINRLTQQAIGEECAGLSIEQVYGLIRTLIDNPDVSRSRHHKQLWDLAGRIMLAADFIDDAMLAFTRANETRQNDMMLVRQVAELANQGYRAEAREHLARFRDNPAPAVHHRLHVYWVLFPRERLLADLEQAIAHQQGMLDNDRD